MSDLRIHALDFATKVHKGQYRKFTNIPYITHPSAVAGIINHTGLNYGVVSAAFLHDTVEDVEDVSIITIEKEFDAYIAKLVEEVTNVATKADGNRAVRFKINLAHLTKASDEGKTIKIADILDNIKNSKNLGSDFAKLYLEEKTEVLKILKGGNAELHSIAEKLIKKLR